MNYTESEIGEMMQRTFGFAVLLSVLVAMTACFPIAFSAPANLLNGPYLLYTGLRTAMTLCWQLDQFHTCTVSWGTSPDSLTSGADCEPNGDGRYEAELTGLPQNSMITYTIAWPDGEFSSRFRSAPSEDASTVSFLAWADTQIPDGVMTRSIASRMLETLQGNPHYATMVLHAGDVVPVPLEIEWQRFFGNPYTQELMSQVPMQTAIGNHDTVAWAPEILGDRAPFASYWPYLFVDHHYWSFDYGPVHIIVADRYAPGMPALPELGNADVEQMAWIQQDLQQNQQPWTILLVHEPPVDETHHLSHSTAYTDYLRPLLQEGSIDLVLSGHWHRHDVFEVEGTPVLAMASASQAADDAFVAFYAFDVFADEMRIHAVAPDGQVLDRIRIEK